MQSIYISKYNLLLFMGTKYLILSDSSLKQMIRLPPFSIIINNASTDIFIFTLSALISVG